MAPKHYDILILGESLAAQIAAVLLARSGHRVLVLQGPEDTSLRLPSIPLSRHLEGVLELLGGRSCLVAAAPFQIITSRSRLTFHGNAPLLDELRRELPNDSDRVAALLMELREIGERLENILWDAGGLPLTGMRGRLQFFWQRMRHRLAANPLHRPLDDRITHCGNNSTAEALRTLFAGLALCPTDRLSVAEGALLWRSYGEERGVSVSALTELLEHRFEQFHGEAAPAEDLQSLNFATQRPVEVLFTNGQRCTANSLLLGNRTMIDLLPPALQPPNPAASAPVPARAKIHGRISPLLAPSILIGGEPTLRVALCRSPDKGDCQVSAEAAPASAPLTPADFNRRIAALIPFTDLQFEPALPAAPSRQTSVRETRGGAFPGAAQAISVGSNLYICNGSMVLPSLGTAGEVLIGTTLANHLRHPEKG